MQRAKGPGGLRERISIPPVFSCFMPTTPIHPQTPTQPSLRGRPCAPRLALCWTAPAVRTLLAPPSSPPRHDRGYKRPQQHCVNFGAQEKHLRFEVDPLVGCGSAKLDGFPHLDFAPAESPPADSGCAGLGGSRGLPLSNISGAPIHASPPFGGDSALEEGGRSRQDPARGLQGPELLDLDHISTSFRTL